MLSLVISCACSYVGAMSEKIVDQLLCRGYPCRKVHYPVMVHYTVRYTKSSLVPSRLPNQA